MYFYFLCDHLGSLRDFVSLPLRNCHLHVIGRLQILVLLVLLTEILHDLSDELIVLVLGTRLALLLHYIALSVLLSVLRLAGILALGLLLTMVGLAVLHALERVEAARLALLVLALALATISRRLLDRLLGHHHSDGEELATSVDEAGIDDLLDLLHRRLAKLVAHAELTHHVNRERHPS